MSGTAHHRKSTCLMYGGQWRNNAKMMYLNYQASYWILKFDREHKNQMTFKVKYILIRIKQFTQNKQIANYYFAGK